MASASHHSKKAVYAALIGNVLVALTKSVAAAFTGSASMLSEAVHSFVDTGNEGVLLYGMHRAGRPPDREHPLGYGRELYFWSFIVALLVFALGAGVSIYEGVAHLRDPEPISKPWVSFVVYGLAFVFEGAAWWVSWQQFRAARGELGVVAAFRRSKDPPLFMVLLEDTAAMAGIVVAALATWASVALDQPLFDGLGSIMVGVILAVTAMLLARESKSLLIGERADAELSRALVEIADAEPAVARTHGVLSVHLAPDQVVAALSLEFHDDLPASRLERVIVDIERQVRQRHPEVVTLLFKPQNEPTFAQNAWRH